MPIFEFRCVECGHVFEMLFKSSDKEVELVCPECSSGTLERVISKTSYVMGSGSEGKKAQVSTKTCGQGSQCGTLELPGVA